MTWLGIGHRSNSESDCSGNSESRQARVRGDARSRRFENNVCSAPSLDGGAAPCHMRFRAKRLCWIGPISFQARRFLNAFSVRTHNLFFSLPFCRKIHPGFPGNAGAARSPAGAGIPRRAQPRCIRQPGILRNCCPACREFPACSDSPMKAHKSCETREEKRDEIHSDDELPEDGL